MQHKHRIRAVVQGEAVDRPPVALWRHFPHDDASAEGLARNVIEFQKKYGFDLVKVTPVAGYPAEAWGADLYYLDNANGTRGYHSRPVTQASDWVTLPKLDVNQGVLGRELEALKMIREGVGGDVHVLQTIFSPLTCAKNLSDTLWKDHLRTEPDALHAGLQTIAETMIDFARASLKSGADAIFFATQLATKDELSEDQYRTYGMRYDMEILEAIEADAELILLHVHGENIMFELMRQYPVHILNWHDQRTAPTLAEGAKQFDGAVLGGLNETATLIDGDPTAVQAEARDALEQAGGRLILGTGCVTQTTTPEANIQAARDAVDPVTA